jgi:hypothetical protein
LPNGWDGAGVERNQLRTVSPKYKPTTTKTQRHTTQTAMIARTAGIVAFDLGFCMIFPLLSELPE